MAFSILDSIFNLIPWDEEYCDVIGVSSQIITTLISMVVSIIGIAISLQNEEYFGVTITKLYALRKECHYSIQNIIIISIVLSALNLTFYMLDLTVAAIGSLLVAILFSLKVSHSEIPMMAKEETAILKIIRTNLICCYINKNEATKDLKDSIKHLLYNKNIAEIYKLLKDDKDERYNSFLLLKLLEYQHDFAFELKNITDESELIKISDSLLENVIDVTLRDFKFNDDAFNEIVKNKHLLTRVLFRIHELPISHNRMLQRVEGLFQTLTFSSATTMDQDKLLSSIIIILASTTVKKGNFSILKRIRKQLSSSDWGIRDISPALNVFAILSMHLYYLCNSEPDVPAELKKEIENFINENGTIEENTKIVSWKKLFSKASRKFAVDYEEFIKLSLMNSNSLEYWLYSNSARYVIFDAGYLTRWYLTNLINSDNIHFFDFNALLDKHPDIKYFIKSFGDACFNDDKIFSPTETMKNIINFYGDSTKAFSIFSVIEERDHKFFDFINKIKIEKLESDAEQAKNINQYDFCKKIKTNIEKTVVNEWGFDSSISINNSERSFSVLIEKFPEAINFEDSMMDFCTEGVLQDITNSCDVFKIYNDKNFETNIKSILCKKLEFVTSSVKNTIPHFYIHTEELKQLFFNVCNPLKEFTSKILGLETLVTQNGFSFNCVVDKVEMRPLTEEELSVQVDKNRRSDGQYVFRGAFLPQEEITKIIDKKFCVLTVVVRHQVNCSKNTVFEIIPYLDKPND